MSKAFNSNRREFLKTTSMAGLAAGLSMTVLPALAKGHSNDDFYGGVEEIPYDQQALPYGYTALEPAIDAMTMEIHYSKHASAYAKNLADAVKAENVDTGKEKLSSLLGKISNYSAKMRNNGGGHYNHEFFWKSMKSPKEDNMLSGSLRDAIVKDFGSFDAFKTQFGDAGKNRFGSGWAWLVMIKDNKLIVGSTPNQDNPLMDVSELKGIPLLGLDVWEHAYYLKYQNKRPDYITAWWNLVNWAVVEKRFDKAK
ncbi:MAG: superoxide dismutase [Chitinophagaceae bacterium]|nr:superoxide dismutase [Chitinophagaceae bacterium]